MSKLRTREWRADGDIFSAFNAERSKPCLGLTGNIFRFPSKLIYTVRLPVMVISRLQLCRPIVEADEPEKVITHTSDRAEGSSDKRY